MPLFQEQALDKAVYQAGQTLLSPSDVDLSSRDINTKFFVPSVLEYEKYRPQESALRQVTVYSGEWRLPDDCLKIAWIRAVNWTRSWGTPAPYVRLQAHQWWVQDRVLYCPSGQWEISYLKKFTFLHKLEDYPVSDLDDISGEHTFYLPCETVPSTVKLSFGSGTASDDNHGNLTGTGISGGTVDYVTGKVTLNFTSPTTSGVKGSFSSVYKYVKELEMTEEIFLDLFATRFLVGFANIKSQHNLEGLPVNINLDDLLSYARERESQFKARLETDKKWWIF